MTYMYFSVLPHRNFRHTQLPICSSSVMEVKYRPYKREKALIFKNILSTERKLIWVTLHVHINCNQVKMCKDFD